MRASHSDPSGFATALHVQPPTVKFNALFVPRLCARIKTLCNSSVLIIPCSRGAANV